MEKVCGIKAEDIRDTARVYAKSERSIMFWGMGISQHIHGTDNSRCLITLALITLVILEDQVQNYILKRSK